jgi:hypothetical protein
MAENGSKQVDRSANQTSAEEANSSTLLPMLIAGMILIVAGGLVVMAFV